MLSSDVPKKTQSKHAGSQVFSTCEERALADYAKICVKMNYGVSTKSYRKLAFQYALANNIKVPATWEVKQEASKDWLRGMMKRNPDLTLRKPEALSLSRATSFTRSNVEKFFKNLEEILNHKGIPPQNIYNCDETGVTTVQKPGKVFAEKGAKRVGGVTSGERGSLVTMLTAVNAVGHAIPPMFIFPRVNFKDYMLAGAPVGSVGGCSTSGWMTSELFCQFLEHFQKHAKATTAEPVLLIMDNHETHISVQAINFAKDSGIILLTLPPHSSDKLQPLDVSVFGPFKSYYNRAADNWMTSNPGKTITIYNIAALVNQAWSSAFSTQNIISGFRKTGIFPFNSDIFVDDDFLCSSVTDRPAPPAAIGSPVMTQDLVPPSTVVSNVPSPCPTKPGNMPSPSHSALSNAPVPARSPLTPADVCPYPKAAPRDPNRKGRKRGSSKILTSTPVKMAIEEEAALRARKKTAVDTKKQNARLKKQKIIEGRKKGIKRRLFCPANEEEESTDEDDEISLPSSEDIDWHQVSSQSEDEEEFFDHTPNVEDGAWVLVAFPGRKGELYYAGQVVEKQEEQVMINFLKKGRKQYTFPDVQDQSIVHLSDIKKVLPTPTIRRGSYSFPIKFPYSLNLV